MKCPNCDGTGRFKGFEWMYCDKCGGKGVITEKIWSNKWMGITYFPFLDHEFIRKLWNKYLCPKGYHLLDEVDSSIGHRLVCDSCQLEIFIDDKKTILISDNKPEIDGD